MLNTFGCKIILPRAYEIMQHFKAGKTAKHYVNLIIHLSHNKAHMGLSYYNELIVSTDVKHRKSLIVISYYRSRNSLQIQARLLLHETVTFLSEKYEISYEELLQQQQASDDAKNFFFAIHLHSKSSQSAAFSLTL
uniref:Uncharacterized protein n=1 Tax=Glossina pallidipes TaxID=7398 RepID=A0A1A9ZAY6_GLOPL